jgi:hypothetical protein
VIVRYLPVRTTLPIPSLGGARIRYRPVMAVRLTGPAGSRLRDGLLDTGADDTMFEEPVATLLGVDLRQAEERTVALVGRPLPVRCRFAPVLLRISDGLQETYEWTAIVGFAATRLRYNLLGQAGFLQFFSADFNGETREATLLPTPSFPGRRI